MKRTPREAAAADTRTLSVLIVDDDPIVRTWLGACIETSEFTIAAETGSAAGAPELARRRNPELLLLDFRLRDGRGTELLKQLRLEGVRTPAVLMTANPEPGFNEAAREAGAQGTVLKSGKCETLLGTLRAVHRGEAVFDPTHPPRGPGRGRLTRREREAVGLVARGLTNKEIARELQVGEETVKTLLARTFSKLGVSRRAEAVKVAHDQGLL